MYELTPDNAVDFLRERGWVGPGPVQVKPLGWGVSNAVYCVTTPEGPFVLKQSRPQLRTRDTWISDIDRVYREQEVMQVLRPLLPDCVVPPVLHSDRKNYVFAMSHAPLDARVWKESLLAGEVDGTIGELAGRVLGRMHEATANDRGLVEAFRDRKVFVQLRVDPFYQRVQERCSDVATAVAPWTEQVLTIAEALCHADYSPKNILTHAGGFTLVDYETAHLGDPAMDLGFFLSHLVLKSLKRRDEREQYFELTRAFWRGYAAEVHFRPVDELMTRGIGHCAVCARARIDGTSPVDYLPEEPKREAVRRLTRRVLHERPSAWEEVLTLCDQEWSAAT
jgi:Ser/Thr protein kinase RdoA (MazF antagonist)